MTKKILTDSSLLWHCQSLFTIHNLSLEEIHTETQVPPETLLLWAEKYNWPEKKEEIAKAECEIQTDKILTRAQLLKKMKEEQDTQAALAFTKLEALALKEAQSKHKLRKRPLTQKSKEEIMEILLE